MLSRFVLLVLVTHGVLGDKRCIVSDGDSDDNPFHGTQLLPAAHWDVDLTCVENLVPIKAEEPCPMYYGVDDPCEEGYFGFLTYYFNSPVVVLDHSSLVTVQYTTEGSLRVEFSSSKAFAQASATWSVDSGLILAVNGEGCAATKNDRCYYNCQGLEVDEVNQVIIAFGWAQDSESLSVSGEAEWGYWKPQADNPLCSPGQFGLGGEILKPGAGSTSGSNPGSGGSNTDSGNPIPSPITPGVPEESNTFGVRPRCIAPIDTTYGLPTACLGDYFDEDLDDQQGYVDVNSDPIIQAFLADLDPQEGQDGQLAQRASHLDVRGGLTWESVTKKLKSACGNFCEAVEDLGKDLIKTVGEWTTVKGSFDQNLPFQIPNPSSREGRTPKDKSITQKDSPWGKALLLKSFKNKEGYMNVYCVGCGVKGNVGIAGRAKWSPAGFSQGEVDLKAFLDIVLQIGIDAKAKDKKSSESIIFEQGLPGLSFGVVTIGPRVSLGYRTLLTAAAKGRALAGAKMGITKGQITLDFVRPDRSRSTGWTPYFKPVFKASGAIQLSAELGLPISLKCGLKITGVLDESVGITDDPSIKATIQAAASIGQQNGVLTGGFKETKGCRGISHQITWRNKLFYKIFSGKDKTIFDTKDKILAQGCIEQTQRPVAPTPNVNTLEGQTQVDPKIGGTAAESQNGTNPDRGELPVSDGQTSSAKRQAQDIPDDSELEDVTGSVPGEPEVSYPLQDLPNVSYNTTDGYELAALVDSTAALALVACSNGNVHVVNSATETLDSCSKTWSLYQGLLVGDAAGRVLHYYRNTMSKVGVSRIRASNSRNFPKEAVPIVFGPTDGGDAGTGNSTSTAAGSAGSKFVGTDPSLDLFFPVICTYTTNTPPRLFVVSDPVAGVSMLKNSAVVYSITGGFVDTCALMPIVRGKHTGSVENEFGEYDDEIDS